MENLHWQPNGRLHPLLEYSYSPIGAPVGINTLFPLSKLYILSSDTAGAKRDLSLVSDSLRRLASFLEEAVVSISSIGLQFSH